MYFTVRRSGRGRHLCDRRTGRIARRQTTGVRTADRRGGLGTRIATRRESGLWWGMATFISHSPEEINAIREDRGSAAARGMVVGLSGDLGAGKTHLTQRVARGLGITERVHSPTFRLVD